MLFSGRPLGGSLSSPPPADRPVFDEPSEHRPRLLQREEELKLAETFERSRQAYSDLVAELPGPLRKRILDGDSEGPALGSRWPLAGLEASFDRLVGLSKSISGLDATARRARHLKRGIDRIRERLIVSNLGVVYLLAHKSRGRGIPYSDLVQEGTLGLIRAVERFDYRRDCRLSSYAHWWIRKSLHAAFTQNLRTIRLPRYAQDALCRLKSVEGELRRILGRGPTASELAQRMNLPEESVCRLIAAATDAQSFDNLEEGTESLRIMACTNPDPLETAIAEQWLSRLRQAIDSLPPRERKVVRLRFGIERSEPKTLAQIGKIFGISRERVRQIEVEALGKLRRTADGSRLGSLP